MSALSQDRETARKDFKLKSLLMAASTTIYKGSIVAINASGYLVPAADAADYRVVGVAYEKGDNSAGADGAIEIRIQTEGIYRFDASSITQAMLGKMMYIVDDHTFDDGKGTNGVRAGTLVEFISATEGWIQVEPNGLAVMTTDASDLATAITLANQLKSVFNGYRH